MSRPKENNFKKPTKDALAGRCGYRCSNPDCRKLTIGPKEGEPEKVQSLGEAAHIYPASNDKNAPRYNKKMADKKEFLSSFDNGIWLCSGCARMIDNDEKKYTVELLKKWKHDAEEEAAKELKTTSAYYGREKDKVILSFFMACFNRPAFKDEIQMESCMEDFLKAINDTITAINTGVLKNRDNVTIKELTYKTNYSYFSNSQSMCLSSKNINNSKWRNETMEISKQLSEIQRKVKKAQKDGIFEYENNILIIKDRQLVNYLNETRKKIAEKLDIMFREAGIGEFSFEDIKYEI